jgi:hypothetical protein
MAHDRGPLLFEEGQDGYEESGWLPATLAEQPTSSGLGPALVPGSTLGHAVATQNVATSSLAGVMNLHVTSRRGKI